MNGQRIILASSSPRRRELLAQGGFAFECVPADCSEDAEGDPGDVVIELAERKARAVLGSVNNGWVVGADTLVSLDGCALGKPADREDAINMLRALSGKTHTVVTGIYVIDARTGKARSGMELSEVTFRRLSDDDIFAYVDTGEPMDKAGAYAIQGGAAGFVTALNGPMDNVMGFPMGLFHDLIKEMEG